MCGFRVLHPKGRVTNLLNKPFFMENQNETLEKLHIRRATPADGQIVHEFISALEERRLNWELFEANYAKNIQIPDFHYFIAEVGGKPVGFMSFHIQILLHHNGRVGEVQEIYVNEGYRSYGIGAKFWEIVKEICAKENVVNLEVTTHKKRVDAQRFYFKVGMVNHHLKFTDELVPVSLL